MTSRPTRRFALALPLVLLAACEERVSFSVSFTMRRTELSEIAQLDRAGAEARFAEIIARRLAAIYSGTSEEDREVISSLAEDAAGWLLSAETRRMLDAGQPLRWEGHAESGDTEFTVGISA